MLQRAILLLTTAALFAACVGRAEETPPAVAADAVTGDAYANPRALVDTEWVLAHLDDPATHFIDVSLRRDSYDGGHLPGAVFVQWDTDLTDRDATVEGMTLPRDSLSALMSRLGVENGHTVVFYDNASNLFAARGYWVLKYYGHDDVRVYSGGSRKWVADEQELTTVVATPARARYVAGDPDPTIATDWQYVVASLSEDGPLVCDTRSADEHAGVDVRAERGGHIPGAVNIEWRRNVNDDGTFLDAQSLADLYGAIARDLADEFAVTVADASTLALDRLADVGHLRRVAADLDDPASLDALLADADLVVGAVPGPMSRLRRAPSIPPAGLPTRRPRCGRSISLRSCSSMRGGMRTGSST